MNYQLLNWSISSNFFNSTNHLKVVTRISSKLAIKKSCQIKGGNTRKVYESSTDPWNECVVRISCRASYFSAFWLFLKLWKVAWHLSNQKLRCYLDPRKNWNCKSWENTRTMHNERFNFHSIWFINEGNIFQITGTRPQLASGHFKLHTSLLALYWPQKIKIWRHKTKNI